MTHETNRRTFIKGSLLTPAAMALSHYAGRASAAETEKTAPAGKLPVGKIGDLEISRMLLGGNLLTHYTHSRDLKYVYDLCAHYNTNEKIMETMAIAEENGINTLVIHTVPNALETMQKYRRERGGKMQWIICGTEPIEPGMKKYTKQIRDLVDNGTEAIYVWGVHSDRLVAEGKMDLMAEAVQVAKDLGVPSGVGGHCLDVIKACEEHNVNADFYIKTFHHHNYPSGPKPDELEKPYNENPGYWCREPQETIDVMKAVEKPWIAFKIMAAGAIPPKDAFPYAFKNGADHILVGMFDFEIEEDAGIARQALANLDRERPWRS